MPMSQEKWSFSGSSPPSHCWCFCFLGLFPISTSLNIWACKRTHICTYTHTNTEAGRFCNLCVAYKDRWPISFVGWNLKPFICLMAIVEMLQLPLEVSSQYQLAKPVLTWTHSGLRQGNGIGKRTVEKGLCLEPCSCSCFIATEIQKDGVHGMWNIFLQGPSRTAGPLTLPPWSLEPDVECSGTISTTRSGRGSGRTMWYQGSHLGPTAC